MSVKFGKLFDIFATTSKYMSYREIKSTLSNNLTIIQHHQSLIINVTLPSESTMPPLLLTTPLTPIVIIDRHNMSLLDPAFICSIHIPWRLNHRRPSANTCLKTLVLQDVFLRVGIVVKERQSVGVTRATPAGTSGARLHLEIRVVCSLLAARGAGHSRMSFVSWG
jgi:hypothetical protein